MIIWKQIIAYSKEHKIADLIFVTSDGKDDWFWKEKGQTIKCRPELTEEICRLTNVERFKIYKTERFLEYASEFLGSSLDKDVLSDVKSVSSRSEIKHNSQVEKNQSSFLSSIDAELAVMTWLQKSGKKATIRFDEYPDLEVYENELRVGYEVKHLVRSRKHLAGVVGDCDKANRALRSGFDRVSIVYVTQNPSSTFWDFINRVETLAIPSEVSLVFGFVDSLNEFNPMHIMTNQQ